LLCAFQHIEYLHVTQVSSLHASSKDSADKHITFGLLGRASELAVAKHDCRRCRFLYYESTRYRLLFASPNSRHALCRGPASYFPRFDGSCIAEEHQRG